jgi:hypothetical protein
VHHQIFILVNGKSKKRKKKTGKGKVQMNTKIQVRSRGSLSDLEKNIKKITFTNKK